MERNWIVERMNMGDMDSGMDSASNGLFKPYNQALAQGYRYTIAGVVGAIIFIYATATAIGRELSYPQIHISGLFSWLSPPSLGRILVLVIYWAIIAFMLTNKAIVNDAYYWERIGFRAAWISVTQVPFVYLLAGKSNVIGYLIGSSHERLNWLHRWVSRTLLITVTIHGVFFLREWIRADFVKLELSMMPMVKYGIGAWAILLWTFLTSLSPLRRIAYEVFVLQHIAAGAVFLWVLYVHVPYYAVYNVYWAIGALCFDRLVRGALLLGNNNRIRATKGCNTSQKIGHEIQLQAMSDQITVITVKDVHLSWKAGQHIYLHLPWLGLLESHPFTIATPFKTGEGCHCHEIQFAVRTQSGFSKRVNDCAHGKSGKESLTGFIAGPFGAPPAWEAYESLILISASTGASYTLPILESILTRSGNTCTKRLSFLLCVKEWRGVVYYEERLRNALRDSRRCGIELEVEIAVTGEGSGGLLVVEIDDIKEKEKIADPLVLVKSVSPSATAASSSATLDTPSGCCCAPTEKQEQQQPRSCCCALSSSLKASDAQIVYSYSRPNISAFIRRIVEITGGETSVAVCGGKSLVADTRNSVARLSDERAVHKGSGAQGIHLHVEEYGF